MSTGFQTHFAFTDHDLDEALVRLGYESFRPGQREAIETLLTSGRLLLVAPTGGGKSLTYQLPATLLDGTTLVISPLVSLMVDQVAALEARGIPATYLAATLESSEIRARMRRIADGAYKLVYVAPERLVFPGFQGLCRDLGCPLVAIDEAHCISEWGHDFRPEYMEIGHTLRALPRTRILACTATATPVVRDEILDRLGLPPDTPQMVRGFARPNLSLRAVEVESAPERRFHVDAALTEALDAPGSGRGTAIVYAPTRKATEAEADRLATRGWTTEAYHAGLPGKQRDAAQAAFLAGRTEIVVATNAFGMGIDRADVRAVVHLAPPGSIEAYYQEVGRAGRDGADALGLLVVSAQDLPLRRRLLERDQEGRAPAPGIVEHKWSLFLELMRWSEGGSCRHDAILRYFGDEEETLAGCGRCDVCRSMDENEVDEAEVTVQVQKALCGVARVSGRFGLQVAVKLLRGVEDDRLEWSGLRATKTFGTMADRSDRWITRLIRRCVTAGWVDFASGERPLLVLTEAGHEVIHGRRPARVLLPPERERPGGRRRRPGAPGVGTRGARGSGTAGVDDLELDAAATELFEALRAFRMETAREENVPPYVVASDRTLREIARCRPSSPEALLLVHGIGPAKVERYGDGLLDVVRRGDGGSA